MKQALFSSLFLTGFNMLYSQNKTLKEVGFGMNIYVERCFEYNLGLGFCFGRYNKYRIRTPIKTRNSKTSPHDHIGFNGIVLKTNFALKNNWNQFEIGYQRTGIFMWGVYFSNTNFSKQHSYGFKPIAGFSFWNIELNYAYYIPLNNWDYVARNNFVLGYRISRLRKQKTK
ncbi:hypothetical protein OAH12_00725 [Cyclobacteriaceae bacterium]|nr:hypothetical protein [Cyclobacteriaceae bacterium]